MKKSISYYLFKGFRDSRKALKKNRPLFLKYSIFLLSSLLGSLTLIAYPIFELANIRIARSVVENGRFKVEDAFEDSNSLKKLWVTGLGKIVGLFALLSGIALIGGLGFALMNVGLQIDLITSLRAYYFYPTFIGLSGALLIIYVLCVLTYFGPLSHIIQKDDVGLADGMKKSVSIMNFNGAVKLIVIYLVHILYLAIRLAIAYGIIYYLSTIIIYEVHNLVIIAFAVIVLLGFPRAVLSLTIARTSLYDDLIEEHKYFELIGSKKQQLLEEEKELLLNSLFDEAKVIKNIVEDKAGA